MADPNLPIFNSALNGMDKSQVSPSAYHDPRPDVDVEETDGEPTEETRQEQQQQQQQQLRQAEAKEAEAYTKPSSPPTQEYPVPPPPPAAHQQEIKQERTEAMDTAKEGERTCSPEYPPRTSPSYPPRSPTYPTGSPNYPTHSPTYQRSPSYPATYHQLGEDPARSPSPRAPSRPSDSMSLPHSLPDTPTGLQATFQLIREAHLR